MPGITPAPRQRPAPALQKAARARPQHRESREQRLFVQRFRLDKRTRDLPACAIPNAGRRSKVTGGILKAEGMEAGAPDWVLFVQQVMPPKPHWVLPGAPARRHFGLCLEFKDPENRGRLSKMQQAFASRLLAHGYLYVVVHSAEDAWRVLTDYLQLKD